MICTFDMARRYPVQFYVSEEEKETIDRAADLTGYPRAAFVRQVTTREAKRIIEEAEREAKKKARRRR